MSIWPKVVDTLISNNILAVYDPSLGMCLQHRYLHTQLMRQPEVVIIEESYVLSLTRLDTRIPRRRLALVCVMPDVLDLWVLTHSFRRCIRGSIVYNDDLHFK